MYEFFFSDSENKPVDQLDWENMARLKCAIEKFEYRKVFNSEVSLWAEWDIQQWSIWDGEEGGCIDQIGHDGSEKIQSPCCLILPIKVLFSQEGRLDR